MHELSAAEGIIDIITGEMSKNNISKVNNISLRIGEMRNIVQGALLFGFECLSKGTPLEGAAIAIEYVPARGKCNSCGHEFRMENYFHTCPECHKTDITVVSGKELEIVEFEGE